MFQLLTGRPLPPLSLSLPLSVCLSPPLCLSLPLSPPLCLSYTLRLLQLLTGRPPYEAPPGQPRRNIIGLVMYDKRPAKDVRVVRLPDPCVCLSPCAGLTADGGVCRGRWQGGSGWRRLRRAARPPAMCLRTLRTRWRRRSRSPCRSASALALRCATRWRARRRGSGAAGCERRRECVESECVSIMSPPASLGRGAAAACCLVLP